MPTAIRPDVRKRFRAIVAKVDRQLAAERRSGGPVGEPDEALVARIVQRDEEEQS